MSGGHFLSSRESPSDLRRIRYQCGSNSNVLMGKSIGTTHFFEKFYKNTRIKKEDLLFSVAIRNELEYNPYITNYGGNYP